MLSGKQAFAASPCLLCLCPWMSEQLTKTAHAQETKLLPDKLTRELACVKGYEVLTYQNSYRKMHR